MKVAVDVEEDKSQFHSFCFGVSNHDTSSSAHEGKERNSDVHDSELLVDSGANSHIMNEEKNFISFATKIISQKIISWNWQMGRK